MNAIAAIDPIISGFIGLLLLLAGAVLALTWLIFPFVLISKIDKMERILREISSKLPPKS